MANKPTPADFSPTVPDFPSIGQYQPIYGKFDLTTYIQGASDYEIMSFLMQCYNATLKGYSDVTQLSKDTATAYNQLQTWVNTWFDNLDVQQEINNKLQSMYEAGTLATVINNTGTVQSTTTNWLQQNVTPTGAAVVVDKSLSIAGAAADSKAVGSDIFKRQPFTITLQDAPFNDFDTYPVNTYSWFSENAMTAMIHSPAQAVSSLLSYNSTISYDESLADVSRRAGTTQIVTTVDGLMYCRFCDTAGNWSDWKNWNYEDFRVISCKLEPQTSEDPAYSDLNTFPNNAIYWYSTSVENAPSDYSIPATVFSYNAVKQKSRENDTNGQSQFMLCGNNGRLYTRRKFYDEWSQWVKYSTVDEINELRSMIGKIESSVAPKYTSSVFKPFNFNVVATFTGDSITSGAFADTNWPTQLNNKLNFAEFHNDAVSGSCITDGVNDVKSITQQVKDVTNKSGNNILFIAGGVNDWSRNVELTDFENAVKGLCSYINENYSNEYSVIFITPINEAGYLTNAPKYDLQDYRNIIHRAVKESDVYARFSVIEGTEFGFPNKGDDADYIAAVFADKLHPSTLGQKVLYTPGVLSKII